MLRLALLLAIVAFAGPAFAHGYHVDGLPHCPEMVGRRCMVVRSNPDPAVPGEHLRTMAVSPYGMLTILRPVPELAPGVPTPPIQLLPKESHESSTRRAFAAARIARPR